MTTILSERGSATVNADARGDALWMSAADAEAASGWTLKPEGLCQGSMCVPVPQANSDDYVADGNVNIAAFWQLMDRPVLHDTAGDTWVLGAGHSDRAQQLETLEAPDFTLPDFDGKMHSLSDYRGKRVFLTTWSSW